MGDRGRERGLLVVAGGLALLIIVGSALTGGDGDAETARGGGGSVTGGRLPPPRSAAAPQLTSATTPPAASAVVPTEAQDTVEGAAPYPPPAPAGLPDPAYAFLLAYNEFSPTFAGAGEQWTRSWSPYATDDLRASGAQAALQLWAFTWQTRVRVISPLVTAVAVVAAGEDMTVVEVDVSRIVVAVDAAATDPGTVQVVSWRVTVTGLSGAAPLVSLCAPLAADGTGEDDSGQR